MSGLGPMISIWDAISAGLWMVGIGTVAADTAVRWNDHLGQWTVIGMTVVVVAAVMTLTSVVRRAKEELLSQMHTAFDMGRDSVRRLKP